MTEPDTEAETKSEEGATELITDPEAASDCLVEVEVEPKADPDVGIEPDAAEVEVELVCWAEADDWSGTEADTFVKEAVALFDAKLWLAEPDTVDADAYGVSAL